MNEIVFFLRSCAVLLLAVDRLPGVPHYLLPISSGLSWCIRRTTTPPLSQPKKTLSRIMTTQGYNVHVLSRLDYRSCVINERN